MILCLKTAAQGRSAECPRWILSRLGLVADGSCSPRELQPVLQKVREISAFLRGKGRRHLALFVPREHSDTLTFLRRASSTRSSFPSLLITGKLLPPEQVQWEPGCRGSTCRAAAARAGGPGAGAVQNLLYKTCCTKPAPFSAAGPQPRPWPPGEGFPTDQSSLLLSTSSPTTAPAATRLSPGGGGGAPGRSHHVPQAPLKDRDKTLREDPGELCGTFPFKSHPTGHCLAPLGQGSQEALPQLLAQHRGSKMMF